MSTEIRTAIAAAANTVDGVNVTPYFRQSTKPGDGMVRLDRTFRDGSGFGQMATWQVAVLLHQDLATAERWVDAHLTELIDAIGEQLIITGAQPVQLALETGTVPALIVSGNRGQE